MRDVLDDEAGRARFVRTHTEVFAPALVPELPLHLGRDFTALWVLVQETLGDGSAPPPYWAFAWPGGQAVARHLLDNPSLVAGRRVVDFATGSGLCALAAAKAGAAHVIAYDIDALAVTAVRENAAALGLTIDARCRSPLDSVPRGAQVILAGDVCYEARPAPGIVTWLRACAAAGKDVFLGDPDRAYRPQDGLVLLAEHEVRTPLRVEGEHHKHPRVYRVLGTPTQEG